MPDTMEMQEITVDGTTKYSIAFGLTDDGGAPLLDRHGKQRFTNLVADTPAELVKKLAAANVEVARALDRTKKYADTLSRRPTPATQPAKIEAKPLTADEQFQVGLDVQDPRKAPDAIKRVVESVVPVEGLKNEAERQRARELFEAGRKAGDEFRALHITDYWPCEANGDMMGRYLKENKLACTVENLEFAFAALQDRLVPIPRKAQPSPTPAADNAPPDNAQPNREIPPAPTRRAPQSGIRNSEASALPASATTTLTREQAYHMLTKEPEKYEAWMRDPQKNAILNRALSGR